MPLTEPWSKKHKRVTRAGAGGMPYSLSNSFAQPLTHAELVQHTLARGDHALLDLYNDHSLGYTPNGGSLDLREEIAKLYGPHITADNVLVFTGAQVALPTAAHALTNGHTHSIVFDPAYQSTQDAPVHAGSQVTKIELKAANGWQIDVAEVRGHREHKRYAHGTCACMHACHMHAHTCTHTTCMHRRVRILHACTDVYACMLRTHRCVRPSGTTRDTWSSTSHTTPPAR